MRKRIVVDSVLSTISERFLPPQEHMKCKKCKSEDALGGEIFCDKCLRERIRKGADDVNHPTHYNRGRIEVIEFIEDQKLGFNIGNAIKYCCRAGHKDPNATKDLRKAIWYLRREIELVTAACESRPPLRPNEMDSGA